MACTGNAVTCLIRTNRSSSAAAMIRPSDTIAAAASRILDSPSVSIGGRIIAPEPGWQDSTDNQLLSSSPFRYGGRSNLTCVSQPLESSTQCRFHAIPAGDPSRWLLLSVQHLRSVARNGWNFLQRVRCSPMRLGWNYLPQLPLPHSSTRTTADISRRSESAPYWKKP